jgi:hypothetical protein
MAGIRPRDKRLTKRSGSLEHRTLFVPGSQYVLFGIGTGLFPALVACFENRSGLICSRRAIVARHARDGDKVPLPELWG